MFLCGEIILVTKDLFFWIYELIVILEILLLL